MLEAYHLNLPGGIIGDGLGREDRDGGACVLAPGYLFMDAYFIVLKPSTPTSRCPLLFSILLLFYLLLCV